MNTIAIIPARKGSKGVPHKNTYKILGKPLICYTIEAALESKLLNGIVVSSDDELVLDIASRYNSIVLHNRPVELASDTSPISKTIDNVLETVEGAKQSDSIMLLQPTSPIRNGKHIDEAILSFKERSFLNSLVSVCPMQDIHPARMYWQNDEELKSILSEYELTRRQDIPIAYYRNGSIYIIKKNSFLEHRKMLVKPTGAYLMPSSLLLNIDEKRDLIIAESLIKAWKKGEL